MKFLFAALLLALPISSFAAERIIGVGMVLKQVEDKTFVEQIVAGAPAAREGTIHEGDEIISVKPLAESDPSWFPIAQLSLDEIVQLIRGDEGTKVGIHLVGERGQYEVVLTREPVDIP